MIIISMNPYLKNCSQRKNKSFHSQRYLFLEKYTFIKAFLVSTYRLKADGSCLYLRDEKYTAK